MTHFRKIALLSATISPLLAVGFMMPAGAAPPIRLAQEGAPSAPGAAPPAQKKEEEERKEAPKRPVPPQAAPQAPRPAPQAAPPQAAPQPAPPPRRPEGVARPPRPQPPQAPQVAPQTPPPAPRAAEPQQQLRRPEGVAQPPRPQPPQAPQAAPQATPQGPAAATPSRDGGDRRGRFRDDAAPTPQQRAAPEGTAPPTAAPLPPPPAIQRAEPIPTDRREGPRNLRDFRDQRREMQQNGRTIITEPGRVIVRDGGRTIIRHNEVDRFRLGARDVRVRREGDNTRTVIVRPDGSQIVNVTTNDGRLLRRMRRMPGGREIVIIDNARRGPGAIGGYFVNLPPPVVRIPRERYIVELDDADDELIYDTLTAPPVMAIERPYTLDEVRYSHSLRERMPRIDVNTITFDTGSWEIGPEQSDKLDTIARAMRRAIERNASEVFLIEGHTDAVGSDIDNLSLSDRRAESVAELLTQAFGVPPENLTTQGYGEQYLKIPTEEAERANRRVTVRRITPLLVGEAPRR